MNGLVLDKDSDVLIGVMNGHEKCSTGGFFALRISRQVSLWFENKLSIFQCLMNQISRTVELDKRLCL